MWIKLGAGKIVINERAVETSFARPVLRMLIQQPIVAASRQGQYDVTCTVSGGGLSGQAGAVRHGLSKALMRHEPDLRTVLKRGGFLTRDPARSGAQEVRQGQGAPQLPVLQALTAKRCPLIRPAIFAGLPRFVWRRKRPLRSPWARGRSTAHCDAR